MSDARVVAAPYDWDDVQARMARARERANAGSYDEAEFIALGARRVIDRYEHHSARWGVITLSLARFRLYNDDYVGALQYARAAAASLVNAGRAASGVPYGEAVWCIGRCLSELGRKAEAVRYYEIALANAFNRMDPDENGRIWLVEWISIDLGRALVALGRWEQARPLLETAWGAVRQGDYAASLTCSIGRTYIDTLLRCRKPMAAWAVIRVLLIEFTDDATWSRAMDAMRMMEDQYPESELIQMWKDLEIEWEATLPQRKRSTMAASPSGA